MLTCTISLKHYSITNNEYVLYILYLLFYFCIVQAQKPLNPRKIKDVYHERQSVYHEKKNNKIFLSLKLVMLLRMDVSK